MRCQTACPCHITKWLPDIRFLDLYYYWYCYAVLTGSAAFVIDAQATNADIFDDKEKSTRDWTTFVEQREQSPKDPSIINLHLFQHKDNPDTRDGASVQPIALTTRVDEADGKFTHTKHSQSEHSINTEDQNVHTTPHNHDASDSRSSDSRGHVVILEHKNIVVHRPKIHSSKHPYITTRRYPESRPQKQPRLQQPILHTALKVTKRSKRSELTSEKIHNHIVEKRRPPPQRPPPVVPNVVTNPTTMPTIATRGAPPPSMPSATVSPVPIETITLVTSAPSVTQSRFRPRPTIAKSPASHTPLQTSRPSQSPQPAQTQDFSTVAPTSSQSQASPVATGDPAPVQVSSGATPTSPTSELAPSLSPKLELAPSLSPKLELAPSLSPKLELAPSLSPKLELAPSLSPKLELAPSLSPKLELAPSLSPKLELAPSLSPKSELAPSLSPKSELAPSLSPPFNMAPSLSPPSKMAPSLSPIAMGTFLCFPFPLFRRSTCVDLDVLTLLLFRVRLSVALQLP